MKSEQLEAQVRQQQAQIEAMADLLIQLLPRNRQGNVLVLNPSTGNFIEAPRQVQELFADMRVWRGLEW